MSLGAANLKEAEVWPKSIVIGNGVTTIVEFNKFGVKLNFY